MLYYKRLNIANKLIALFIPVIIIFAALNNNLETVIEYIIDLLGVVINLSLRFISIISFWLVLSKTLDVNGLIHKASKSISTILQDVFPDVYKYPKIINYIILNFIANIVGFTSASEVIGIRTIKMLNDSNLVKYTMTNSMCLFITANASSIAFFPLGIVAIRYSLNSIYPMNIILTIIPSIAILVLTIISLLILFQKFDMKYNKKFFSIYNKNTINDMQNHSRSVLFNDHKNRHLLVEVRSYRKIVCPIFLTVVTLSLIKIFFLTSTFHFFLYKFIYYWCIPLFIIISFIYSVLNGVKVYDVILEASGESIQISFTLIPITIIVLGFVSIIKFSGILIAVINNPIDIGNIIPNVAKVLNVMIFQSICRNDLFIEMINTASRSPDSYVLFFIFAIQNNLNAVFYIFIIHFNSIKVKYLRHTLKTNILANIFGVLTICLSCWVIY